MRYRILMFMYDLINDIYSKDNIINYKHDVSEKSYKYIKAFVSEDKPSTRGIEMITFISKVIYPKVNKDLNNKKLDRIIIALLCLDIATDYD